MASAEEYANWIVNNAAKRGTPEFDTVAQAYQLARGQTQQQVPNTLADVGKSALTGATQGFSAIPGMFGDLASFANPPEAPATTTLGKIRQAIAPSNFLPTTNTIASTVAAPFGGLHQPETTMGEYARTIGNFAPAALAPGSLMKRAARAIVPGAVSETAGQVTKGTPYEGAARIAGGLTGAAATEAAPLVADLGKRAINRLLASAGRPEIIDPKQAAIDYLAPALNRKGTQAIGQSIQDWQAAGNEPPSWLDVGGNELRRRMRYAASGEIGDAQDIAQQYNDATQGNLQRRAGELGRALTPGDQTSAADYQKSLENLRSDLATEQYREPYAQPANVTKDMVSALSGPEGRRAIGEAYATARARRDFQQMGELQDLLTVAKEQGGGVNLITGTRQSIADALKNVSAGSLDRVRIAMRETGNALAAKGNNARASGYFGRVNDLDTALNQTPNLQEARSQYRSLSNQMEAVQFGQSGISKNIADEASRLSGMEKVAGGIGYRDAIVSGIEHPAAGSTGILNRLATATDQAKTLEAFYGPEAANKFRTGISNEIERLRNARFINPNLGSQTAPRSMEALIFDSIPTGKINWLKGAIDFIRGGGTLTPAQRAEIIRLGTSEANLRLLARTPAPTSQIARQLMTAGILSHAKMGSQETLQ